MVNRQFDTEEVRLAQHMALAASRAYEVTALYHNLHEELNRREKAEETLDKRQRYLEALVNVLMDLLSLESGANVNEQVLPLLGMLTEADRVAVYELSPSADGHSYLRQMDAWNSPKMSAEVQPLVSESYPFTGELEALLGGLQTGQYLAASLSDLPENLRRSLESLGVKSTLILPLYAKSELTGYISFNSFNSTREWDTLQVALLQATAAAVSLTRERIETGEALKESESRYRLVVENAKDVIFQIDMTGRFTF